MLRCTQRPGAVAIAVFCAAGSAPASDAFALQQLAPGVYAHEGEVAQADAINQGDIDNLGLVIGERGAR